MITVQEMCGRIGLVSGKGLSGVIKRHYPKPLLWAAVFLLFLANTINIGADLGAMAAATQLLFPIPLGILIIIMTVLTVLLIVFVPYRRYVKYLKYFAITLFAYIIAAFAVSQNWREIALSTLIPHISGSKAYLLNIVAFLGTTISPYLFFWETNEEVEEEVAQHKLKTMGSGIPKITIRDIRHMRVDTGIGMVFSNVITFFIIITTAATLGAHGLRNIETADQAAAALKPIAGPFASLLFTIGIIGTGLLAIPVLAGSISYAVSEVFGWKEGLYRKLKNALGFYGLIIIVILFGVLINFVPIKPFQLLYYTAVLNGICAPPLLILIMLVANNKGIMGRYTNTMWSNVSGILITVLMTLAVGALLVTSFLPTGL
jgi:Mn2+/Fe2+ NRAMP family transporter